MVTYLGALSFATPFSREIMDALRLRKVKVLNLELYDRTTHPEEHAGGVKAQMYLQDVDDVTYCQYFHTTQKVVA